MRCQIKASTAAAAAPIRASTSNGQMSSWLEDEEHLDGWDDDEQRSRR
ncbi:hypothetical protein ACX80O_07705 [Arthrobacter sp. Hz1]